jgi:hypothetical protein
LDAIGIDCESEEGNSDSGNIINDGKKSPSYMELQDDIDQMSMENEDYNKSNKQDNNEGSSFESDQPGFRRTEQQEKEPCKHWLNPKTGCGRADKCPYSHEQDGYIEEKRAKALKKLLRRTRNRARKRGELLIDQQD